MLSVKKKGKLFRKRKGHEFVSWRFFGSCLSLVFLIVLGISNLDPKLCFGEQRVLAWAKCTFLYLDTIFVVVSFFIASNPFLPSIESYRESNVDDVIAFSMFEFGGAAILNLLKQ